MRQWKEQYFFFFLFALSWQVNPKMILTLTASIMYRSLQNQGPYQCPGPQDALPEEEEGEEEEEEEEDEEDFEGGVEDGVSKTTTW